MNEPLDAGLSEHSLGKKIAGISIGIAILMAIIFVVMQGVAGLPFGLFMSIEEAIAYALLLSYVGSLLVGKQFIPFPSFTWGNGSLTPMTVIVSIVFFVAVKIGTSMPMEFIPGYEELMQGYLDQFGGFGLPVMIIASLVTPVVEEVYFRGMIQRGLNNQYNEPYKAILISSVLFGIIHVVPIQVVAAAGMGMALGWIYYKTKSLWYVIIIHAINNAIAFVAMQFMDMEDASLSTRADIGNDAVVLGLIVGCIAVAYGCFKYLDKEWDSEQANIIT